jgi:hypothetical protein
MVTTTKTGIKKDRPGRRLLVTMAISAPIIFLVVVLLS